ncbi:hypothetical protein NIES2109_22660 [Nostoc sp. HK-01]|nr:hypothetical protein NIES2109_22660 [Nostoc sp. HK-01]
MRDFMIKLAIIHRTTELILGEEWEIEKAMSIKQWLKDHEGQLPPYEPYTLYMESAVKLWRESNK